MPQESPVTRIWQRGHSNLHLVPNPLCGLSGSLSHEMWSRSAHLLKDGNKAWVCTELLYGLKACTLWQGKALPSPPGCPALAGPLGEKESKPGAPGMLPPPGAWPGEHVATWPEAYHRESTGLVRCWPIVCMNCWERCLVWEHLWGVWSSTSIPRTCLQEPSPSPVSFATSAPATRRTCACMCAAGMPAALKNGDGATLRSPPLAVAPSSPCSRSRN